MRLPLLLPKDQQGGKKAPQSSEHSNNQEL